MKIVMLPLILAEIFRLRACVRAIKFLGIAVKSHFFPLSNFFSALGNEFILVLHLFYYKART